MCNGPVSGGGGNSGSNDVPSLKAKRPSSPNIASAIQSRAAPAKARQAQQPGHVGRNSGTRIAPSN